MYTQFKVLIGYAPVDSVGIRPVCLDYHSIEAFFFDESLRDERPLSVEFVCPMAGLSYLYAVSETTKKTVEG